MCSELSWPPKRDAAAALSLVASVACGGWLDAGVVVDRAVVRDNISNSQHVSRAQAAIEIIRVYERGEHRPRRGFRSRRRPYSSSGGRAATASDEDALPWRAFMRLWSCDDARIEPGEGALQCCNRGLRLPLTTALRRCRQLRHDHGNRDRQRASVPPHSPRRHSQSATSQSTNHSTRHRQPTQTP